MLDFVNHPHFVSTAICSDLPIEISDVIVKMALRVALKEQDKFQRQSREDMKYVLKAVRRLRWQVDYREHDPKFHIPMPEYFDDVSWCRYNPHVDVMSLRTANNYADLDAVRSAAILEHLRYIVWLDNL
jgi:hypothetical protein